MSQRYGIEAHIYQSQDYPVSKEVLMRAGRLVADEFGIDTSEVDFVPEDGIFVKEHAWVGYTELNLCGGVDDQAARAMDAVWEMADQFLRIEIHTTYLEDLPYDTHEGDEADYARFLKRKASA